MRFFSSLIFFLLPLAMQAQPPRKALAVFTREDSLSMVQIDTLNAAIVEADKEKRTAVTQTSLTRIDGKSLSKGFAALGTPDLIRALQQLPGVASGSELSNGLYVRGGDGSDNLFLLDGVPMYQVSHLVGMFSSFNTDMVENLDFYKGGFPARYGGRLSSVVDVSVNEGGFDRWGGSASFGAVDGRLQIDGPVVKGKTSLNLGMRRTWTDIVKGVAMLFIDNPLDEEMAASSSYNFGDFNLKLTHRFSPDSKLSLSTYYGNDFGKALMKTRPGSDISTDLDLTFRLVWGNTLGTLKWERRWHETLFMDAQLYHTRYTSDMDFSTILSDTQSEGASMKLNLEEHNLSRVRDTGASVHFYSRSFSRHSLRFGGDMVWHIYDPSRGSSQKVLYNGMEMLSEGSSESKTYDGGEVNIFAEDEMSFSERAKLNIGLRNALFIVSGKVYNRLEPRVAGRFFLSDNLSFKASYTSMNQFTHQVAATYLDLPTNLWMPSTTVIKPMHADQGVAGFIYRFSRALSLDVECFYKNMTHLYEYTGVNTMLPQIDRWEDVFSEGRGRAYGAELSLEYRRTNMQFSAYYTLSRSERLFKSAYWTWYPDRNDNRHRLTLTGTYRFKRNFELYAGWTYHSGNRFTGKTAFVSDGTGVSYDIYGSPNNYKLPDYHRLDLGFNWHHKTRNRGERTLNVSVYNAYCRVNAMFGFIEEEDGKMQGVAYGLIPVIPTINYIWKF